MIVGLVMLWLLLWVGSIAVGYVVGGRTGMRYEGLALTIILGFLGLLVFTLNLATDRPSSAVADLTEA